MGINGIPNNPTKSINRLSQKLVQERGRIIVKWWTGKGQLPEPFETVIAKNASISLVTVLGKVKSLRGGLGKNKFCWLFFEEKDDHKLIHVFEKDKKTLINSFYLVKNGEILENPEPVKKSPQQLAQERAKAIARWWMGKGPIPESFESITSKNRNIRLVSFGHKHKYLMGGLGINTACWLFFEHKDNHKLAHVFERDKKTLIRSFYLVRNGRILDNPEPAQKTPLQLAQKRGRTIAEWWEGGGPLPQSFKIVTSKSRNIHLTTLKGKRKNLRGGIGKNKPYWLSFEHKNNHKLVHVFERDKKTLVRSFYLVRNGETLEDPEPVQKSPYQLALERGKAIAEWWTGKGLLPESFEIFTSKGRIDLVTLEGKQKYLMGGLESNKPCWLSFEEKDKHKIIHVFEKDRKTLMKSFYLVKNGHVLDNPEPLQKSSVQLARERGRIIAKWWEENGPVPQPFESNISNKEIALPTLKGKKKSLSGGLGRNRLCWLSFEEKDKHKIIHVFKRDRKTLINSFYLVKNGRALENPEPLQKSSKQLAEIRTRAFTEWWIGNGPLPHSFKHYITKGGQISLVRAEGRTVSLTGGLGKSKSCWITFEQKNNNRLIHVFEKDKTTLINSFYLVKNGQVLEAPEPVKKSSRQLARQRGREISEWWTGDGLLPEPFETISIKGGSIYFITLKGKRIDLTGGLGSKKNHWLLFEQRGNHKLIHVFEKDKKSLINSFYLVKNGQVLEAPEPVQKLSRQLIQRRGTAIAEWWVKNGPLPQSFKIVTSKGGNIPLTSLEGKRKYLIGGLGKSKPCWISFEEKDNHKLVHVFEKDKRTLINSFYLVKNGKILDYPVPEQKSLRQLIQERGEAIAKWWVDNGPLPQPFEIVTPKRTEIRITSLERKKKALVGGFISNRAYWLSFEEKDNHKLIHVFEADRKTLINSFYLVKNGKALEDPEPERASSWHSARERGQNITEWWMGNVSPPPPLETVTGRGGTITLTVLKGKARHLMGGLGSKKVRWLTFEEKGKSKIVHVYKPVFIDPQRSNFKLNSFYLVKNGQPLKDPEPAQKSSTQLARERGRAIAKWWIGKGPLPPPFETSSKKGNIFLTTLNGEQKRLMRGLERSSLCWVLFVFEKDQNNKIAIVYREDKTTLVNAFYLVKNGTILYKPEQVEDHKKDALARITGTRPPVTLPEPSERQELRYGFGRADYDAIASDYSKHLLGIAPYWIALARNSLLLQLQSQGKIPPLQFELSLGAGPSTSHLVWTNLSQNIRVFDLDQSQTMLQQGSNPLKVRASMAAPLPFRNNSFDLVSIDSTFRHVESKSRLAALQEARRTLNPGGILSITELGYLFDQNFITSLSSLGFKVLTPPWYHMELDKNFRQRLVNTYSKKVAKKIVSFLRNCGTLIATKEADPLPKPVEIPRFELETTRKAEHDEGKFIAPQDPEDLGNYDKLVRSQLGIKDIPAAISPTRRRLKRALAKEIKDPLTLERIIDLILSHASSGNLLEITRDPEMLSRFNREIEGFGFKLRLIKRRQVAHLEKIT